MANTYLTPEEMAGGPAFSSNGTSRLGNSTSTGAYCIDPETKIQVFGSSQGSLRFVSASFDFELDNPVDDQEILEVCPAGMYGIYVTLSQKLVQVWDIFRDVDGKRTAPVHTVALSGKPRSLCSTPSAKSCYVGLDSGKIMVIDFTQCVSTTPLPRFSASLFAEAGSSVTSLRPFRDQLLFVGTESGVVKVVRFETKKVVCTVKPPTGVSVVSGICPIPLLSISETPDFVICYDSRPMVSLVSDGQILISLDSFSVPAKSAFCLSVKEAQKSPIILHLRDNTVVRLDGPKWSHGTTIFTEKTLSLRPSSEDDPLGPDASSFTILQQTGESTLFRKFRIESGLGPLVPEPIPSFDLSTAVSGRTPVKTLSLSRADSSLEPNLIRLANSLVGYPVSSTNRFLFDWNAGQWAGVLVSVFNAPCELVFSVYSHTSARVLGKVPLDIPPLSAVSTFTISCQSPDKWSVLLGFTSGQVGLLESSSEIGWTNPITFLEAPESVHAGARVVDVNLSVLNGNIASSTDVNGMVCFTRLQDDKKHPATTPAYVAIGGEGGMAFVDPDSHWCYICMSEGIVEKVKLPRMRDGKEDVHDSDVWSATTVADSIPLSGPFISLYPTFGVAVREGGVVLFVPTTFTVKKIYTLSPEKGSSIRESGMISMGYQSFVVCLTDSHVIAVDTVEAVCVFSRPIANPANTCLLPGSMHMFEWGVGLTSLLFADRAKAMTVVERILTFAQLRLGFPKIQSSPLLVTVKEDEDGTAAVGKKKGVLGKMFSSSSNRKEKANDEKFKPTQAQLDAARKQLMSNLDAMSKLQDDAAEMEDASADFLTLAQQVNAKYKGKKSKKFLGIF